MICYINIIKSTEASHNQIPIVLLSKEISKDISKSMSYICLKNCSFVFEFGHFLHNGTK